jgi:uncharacterized protein (DUF3084 family)
MNRSLLAAAVLALTPSLALAGDGPQVIRGPRRGKQAASATGADAQAAEQAARARALEAREAEVSAREAAVGKAQAELSAKAAESSRKEQEAAAKEAAQKKKEQAEAAKRQKQLEDLTRKTQAEWGNAAGALSGQ